MEGNYMLTIVTSIACLFGIFEFFAFLGTLDFSWAIERGSYHSMQATIDGPAHWVYKGTDTHVRNATAKDIEIHNRNVMSSNAYAARMNETIRRNNRGATGRGFAEWRQTPFLYNYGTNRRWFPPTATVITFLFLAYTFKDLHLLFTSDNGFVNFLLIAANLIYIGIFCAVFVGMHDYFIGGSMKYFYEKFPDIKKLKKPVKKEPKDSAWNRYGYSYRWRKKKYIKIKMTHFFHVVTFVYKFIVMLTTILYLIFALSRNPKFTDFFYNTFALKINPILPEFFGQWFFGVFIGLAILIPAYIFGWFFSGEVEETWHALRIYEEAKKKK
jgi:hypothetical protein